MTTRTTKDMRIAAAREREAKKTKALREQEAGSVVVLFRKRQSKPHWWERTDEIHFMRVFSGARYELRSTPTTSFIAIIQATASGPVEFLYDWRDVKQVSTFPRIEPSKTEETKEEETDG